MLAEDSAAKFAWDAGMYVASVSIDSGETYTATLRQRGDLPFMTSARRTLYVRRGRGKTIEEAIRNATLDDFADILG